MATRKSSANSVRPQSAENESEVEQVADMLGTNDGLDDESTQSAVAAAIDSAANYIDSSVSPERAKLKSLYDGDDYGDEKAGRSSFITREVHDTVFGQLPDILRVLLGPEQVCTYRPETARDAHWTKQATDFADYVINHDNDGFRVFYSAIKDALIVKNGFLKCWWEESDDVRWEYYTSITRRQALALSQYEDVEEVILSPAEDSPQVSVAEAGTGEKDTGQTVSMFVDMDIKRKMTSGRIAFASLPPEEFLISEDGTTMEDASLVAHRTEKTVSELVEMGYDRDEMMDYAKASWLEDNPEKLERSDKVSTLNVEETEVPLNQKVQYIEAYMRVDRDGDDIAELRQFCTVGGDHDIVHEEPAEVIPFVDLKADIEPHSFFGVSTAEKVADIQRIGTSIQRHMLDSLAQSVHPRTGVVEGQVNMDDVLNNEVGGVIRQRQPGMVQDLSTNFVGREAMPVLDHLNNLREMRTGVTRQSLGLDADELQSTNEKAIQQTISGSQGKIEIICRVIADGMKQLYRLILHLAVRNQSWTRMIPSQGQYVEVDPRTWRVDAAVDIDLSMGTGTIQDRMQSLQGIMAKQEQVLTQFGMNQPIVSPQQYANALRKWTELAGWRDSGQFFSAVPEDWQPPKPQPPEPDIDQQIKMAELELERKKERHDVAQEQRDDEIERESNLMDAVLKRRELELKYGTELIKTGVRPNRMNSSLSAVPACRWPRPR